AAPAPTASCTLPLHDALPISRHVEAELEGDRDRPGPVLDVGATLSRGERERSPPCHRPARWPHLGAPATRAARPTWRPGRADDRSEEHTSELQSHLNLVCRLL